MHCAKAFRRSELWNVGSWPDRSVLPSLACILRDQMPALGGVPTETLDQMLEADYANTLWLPGGQDQS